MRTSHALLLAGGLGLAIIAAIAPITRAEDKTMMGGMDAMPGMDEAGKPSGDGGPSSLVFQGANAKMHRDMAIVFTGNADIDFVKGMIPHHQGAIDMAKIELAFGDDPEIRKLAEGIVAAQEAEIALMQAWLKKQGQ